MATKAQRIWNADGAIGIIVANKSCRISCCPLFLPPCFISGLSQVVAPPLTISTLYCVVAIVMDITSLEQHQEEAFHQ